MLFDFGFALLGVLFLAMLIGVAFYLISPTGKKFFSKIKLKGNIVLKDQLYLDHKRRICIVERNGKEYILFCGDKNDFLIDSSNQNQNPTNEVIS